MKSDKIINNFKKRFKKVKKHYHKLFGDFATEEIHGFRLEMKKLRAFIRLINTNTPKKKKIKIGRKIKSLYNTTGNIRNLQLHQQRVGHLCDEMLLKMPVQYMQLLYKEENKQKKKAGQRADKISFKHFRRKINVFAPHKLNTESLEGIVLHKQRALIALIFLENYSDEALHKIRKFLKDLTYNWKYINSYLPAALPAYCTNKKNIAFITDKIGEFHDLCIALYFLKPVYLNKIVEKEEQKILLNVKRKLVMNKGEMKKEINTLLNYKA